MNTANMICIRCTANPKDYVEFFSLQPDAPTAQAAILGKCDNAVILSLESEEALCDWLNQRARQRGTHLITPTCTPPDGAKDGSWHWLRAPDGEPWPHRYSTGNPDVGGNWRDIGSGKYAHQIGYRYHSAIVPAEIGKGQCDVLAPTGDGA